MWQTPWTPSTHAVTLSYEVICQHHKITWSESSPILRIRYTIAYPLLSHASDLRGCVGPIQ